MVSCLWLLAKVRIVYTRTGRRFFNDANLERSFLDRLRAAMTASRFWEDLKTTWACFDCELMPWSAKAQELLRSQYAAVGSAGLASLPKVLSVLDQTAQRLNGDRNALEVLTARFSNRRTAIDRSEPCPHSTCVGNGRPRAYDPEPRLAHGNSGTNLSGRYRTAARNKPSDR
jgi:hypothetical protein